MSTKTIILNTSISPIDKNVEDFFRLTKEALNTDSAETFFSFLIEREALHGLSEQFSSSLSPEGIAKILFIEGKILERLKLERKKIIRDIDKLSRQMKTARAYLPRFPFPSMPAFLDQTG